MSLLSIAPEIVSSASENLAGLGSALRSATATAATQTTSIAAPAADEISAAITELFGTHAQGFQAASAKAAAFHDDFVNLLKGGTAQYAGTEAAADTSLRRKLRPVLVFVPRVRDRREWEHHVQHSLPSGVVVQCDRRRFRGGPRVQPVPSTHRSAP